MSNSTLVSYTKISPNRTSPRTHKIDTITIHCVVGQLTAEGIVGCFTSPSVQASCNYGIGTDGRIALCVEEKDRSWCSSNAANDHRAVTIEGGGVSDAEKGPAQHHPLSGAVLTSCGGRAYIDHKVTFIT